MVLVANDDHLDEVQDHLLQSTADQFSNHALVFNVKLGRILWERIMNKNTNQSGDQQDD